MKEKPILFSAPMVKALLAGTKTMTRRIMKPQPIRYGMMWEWGHAGWSDGIKSVPCVPGHSMAVNCPYPVGTRLWVRESGWKDPQPFEIRGERYHRFFFPDGCVRHENGTMGTAPHNVSPEVMKVSGLKSTPSIFMPRWASRITLEVTAVKVERLQDISEQDAAAEGLEAEMWDMALAVRDYSQKDGWFCMWGGPHEYEAPISYVDLDDINRASFRTLWDQIHGDGQWDKNPWCWCYTFRRL